MAAKIEGGESQVKTVVVDVSRVRTAEVLKTVESTKLNYKVFF